MSFAAKTMATNITPASIPSLFAVSKASHAYPCLSIPSKPFNFRFLSLKRRRPLSRVVSVIAAQQEENNPVVVEEREEVEGNLNWDASESDGEVRESDGEVRESDGEVRESGGEVRESGGYAGISDDAKLFVGNLPYDIDSGKLAGLFQEAGVVEVAEVIYRRDTDISRGFGFVTMSTVEEAAKAVEMFHLYDLGGRQLTVNIAAPRGTEPKSSPRAFSSAPRMYVSNLPWNVDEARLEEVFSEYGKVVSARVILDRETGRSRGFGFVEMSSESEMNDAIANLDGQSLDGREVRVSVAQARRPSF